MMSTHQSGLKRHKLIASALVIACGEGTAPPAGTAAATQLVFTVQPTTMTAGTITPVQVAARDAQGSTATDFTGSVTLRIVTHPAGDTLPRTTTVAAVTGVATFVVSIEKAGSYTLAATATRLASATSEAFTITPGLSAQLVFTVQPSNTPSGAAIIPAVEVTAQDAHGNVTPSFRGNVTPSFRGNVTLSITAGTWTSGVTPSGTTTVATVAGVATFSTLCIDRSGTGYRLSATATGLTGATSAAFDIHLGEPSLALTEQPTNTAAGATISPAVQVTVQDARGNAATCFTGTVTVAITSGTGSLGATLSGTTTVAAVGGVATFSTVSIDRSGAGYRLSATATGLPGATSVAFTITDGTATRLVLTVPPSCDEPGMTVNPGRRGDGAAPPSAVS
ncbi:MAG: hypothetical protein ACREMM_05520 [Gemmatimonadales bacterium]